MLFPVKNMERLVKLPKTIEKACFFLDRLGEFVMVVISLEKPVKEDRLMRSAKKGMGFLGNVRLGLQSDDVSPITYQSD